MNGSPATGSLPPGFADHHTVLTVLPQRERPSAHPLWSVPAGWRGVGSLYVHIPFCSHKCHYCDFYSLVDTRDRQAAFVDRLIQEMEGVAPWFAGVPLRTVFVGGGTPSLLRIDLWERVLSSLHRLFATGMIAAGKGEFTVECNPETASEGLMAALAAGGVNRVSVGAQSFEMRHLRTLERRHDPGNVARAVDAARKAGIARQSVDLIFGVPGQTHAEWERDVERAIGLGTTHLSCYALTYEPNTAMTARMRRGEFEPIEEETEAEMMRWTAARRDAGLARYEVSNFAAPGAECRHNLAYWRQEQWIGVGPSAASHVLDPAGGSRRWRNVPRLDDYLGWTEPMGLATDAEEPDARRLLAERLMTGVRIAEGVDAAGVLAEARAISGESAERLEGGAARLIALGWLEAANGRWRPTDDGFLFADRMARKLMAAVG
ncbi:MAG TPA: radical SAM family heme chaperone HemW [Phycisphaerales bacterium]|nr:radical SAM family heme chaperone HemW [Phycisphaerales bacterium]